LIKRRILLAEISPRIALDQVFAVWDAASGHPDIALSNGSRTATRSTTDPDEWALVPSSIMLPRAGRQYWETTVTFTGSADIGVGVQMRSGSGFEVGSDPGSPLGLTRSVSLNRAGAIRSGGDTISNVGALPSGAVIRHLLDDDAGTYQIAVNGGAWFDALPEQGYWRAHVIAPIAAIKRPSGPTASVTANFGHSAFVYPVPDGASAGIYTQPSAPTTLYLGSEGFDATIGGTPVHFEGRIADDQDVETEREGSCWVWGGQSISRRGQLVVVNNDGALDAWRDYVWRDAPVVFRQGWDGDDFSDFTVWAFSRVDQIELTRDARIVLTLADPVAWLDRQLQRALYPATQANLQLAGQPLPIVYGEPLYCTPAKLSTNPVERHYQLDDVMGKDALYAINAVFDRGDLFAGPDDEFTAHAAITGVNGGDFGGWTGTPALPSGWALPPGAGVFMPNDRFADGGSGYMRCTSKHAPSVEMMHSASTLQERRRYRITFECTSILTAGTLVFRVPGSPDVSVSLTTTGMKSVALYTRATGQLRLVMHGDGIDVFIRTLRVSSEQIIDWEYWSGTQGFTLANTPAGKVVANPANLKTYLSAVVSDIVARVQLPSIDIDGVTQPGLNIPSVLYMTSRADYAVAAYLDKPITGLALLRSLLDGWCGYVTTNRLGQITVGRVSEPRSSEVSLVLSASNIVGELIVTSDTAKRLTLRLAGAKNNTVHTSAEIAAGVPVELSTALQTPFLQTVEGASQSSEPVSSAYAAAIGAPAQETLLMAREDLQKEANRVATLWRPARNFYQLTALLDAATADALEPGQTVRLIWPRWGLESGKDLLVVGVRSRFFSRRVQLKLWG
jgi:hypothetical protein